MKLELKWVDGERLQILTVADSAIKSTSNGSFPYRSYRQFRAAECRIGLSSVELSTKKTLTEVLTIGYESQSEQLRLKLSTKGLITDLEAIRLYFAIKRERSKLTQ